MIAAVGIACGIGLAYVQVQANSGRATLLPEELEKHSATEKSADKPDESAPKAVVDSEVFDFGVMDKSGRSSHEFTITNEGKSPLTVLKGHSTCRCTMAKFDRRTVLPGESTKIKIEWTAREYLGDFEQIATIKTNDPDRPEIELRIKGITVTMLQFMPDELLLGRISAGESVTSVAKLLSHSQEPVKILSVECAEPETADFFDVSYTPLKADALKSDPKIKGGYEIKVELKPGLPQGTFQQTIRVHTSLPAADMVELPIKGQIASDVSIVGSGWNKEKDLLQIGMVDGEKGAKRTLRLVAHGPHRKKIEYKVAKVEPSEFLHVELGKTTEINRGKAMQTPLEIEIPKGSRPVNHLASQQGEPGRIVLDCNQPNVPKIIILVQFAVEGG